MKILQNYPETGAIFSQPPLISFKRDKNTFKTIEKPGTLKFARSRQKRRQLSSQKHIQNNWGSLVLLNARARDAKHVLSSKTLTKYQALSDLFRSLIGSRVPRQMLSIV